jgi:hypothetical protein
MIDAERNRALSLAWLELSSVINMPNGQEVCREDVTSQYEGSRNPMGTRSAGI